MARRLGELPKVGAALERGELSYSKVRAITRVASETTEDTLLLYARKTTAAQLEKICRQYRTVQRLNGKGADVDRSRRHVVRRDLDDGMVRIEAVLRPEEAAIDYQPEQYAGVHSMDQAELVANVTLLGQVAIAFRLPVVLSTVYVRHGMSGTNDELRTVLPGIPEIDRTTMNSWEDPDFHAAVTRTGRKKLIIAGLWTEVCVAFPTLDALREGFEVYVVADAIGGVSKTAHDAAMQRMVQAGAIPITVLGLACELQRDWGRPDAERLRATMRAYFGAHRTKR